MVCPGTTLFIIALAFDTEIRRVLIDTGADCDVLFYSCFKAMSLTDAHLTPSHVKVEGFITHLVAAKGMMELAVTI